MANSITTNKGKEKLVKARAGDIVLPPILKMAFGNGGTDVNGTPISPEASDISLKNELLRKDIDVHTFPSNTTCRYSCRLINEDLAGEVINEIGLIDAEGDLIAIKTFTDKPKDADMQMIFEIDDQF